MNLRIKLVKRFKALAYVLLAVCFLLYSACDDGEYIEYDNDDDIPNGETQSPASPDGNGEIVFETEGCFSVHFIDVGEGDAILIDFADGKTMLIDCGEKTESNRNLNAIENYLDEYTTDGMLNYLVLTHPDSDHAGNAAAILTDYKVETAYIPRLSQPENFAPYCDAYNIIENARQARTMTRVYSEAGKTVCGDEYYLVFLSPDYYMNEDSAYYRVNFSADPSADDINNVSPIIYLDYKGVRFIFTGDAGFSQEKVALNNVDSGLVNGYLRNKQKPDVNFTDIDFLKVSHHGSSDASGTEFLQRITPENAVISVSGDNIYGFPKQETLSRILTANENCNLYLTSVVGTVSVFVNEYGQTMVKTAAATAA